MSLNVQTNSEKDITLKQSTYYHLQRGVISKWALFLKVSHLKSHILGNKNNYKKI